MNDKLMQSIRAVEPGRYDCTLPDIAAIRDAEGRGPLDTGWDCFRYGFLKGQQAARAEAKRKGEDCCRREARKNAPGYGLLMAMVEKNKSNERYVKIVARFAIAMDGGLDAGVDKSE